MNGEAEFLTDITRIQLVAYNCEILWILATECASDLNSSESIPELEFAKVMKESFDVVPVPLYITSVRCFRLVIGYL